MKKKIVIWGSGRYGDLAYHYYQEQCDIVCYIDTNVTKWGKKLNGITICDESAINKCQCVIIAIKYGAEELREQLHSKYSDKDIVIFNVLECLYKEEQNEILDSNTIVVNFAGGLGNQMFQYAVYRCLELQKKKVTANLSEYKRVDTRDFELTRVFSRINLKIVCDNQVDELVRNNYNKRFEEKKFLIYCEPSAFSTNEKQSNLNLLDISGGVLSGWFQSCCYAKKIDKELLKSFSFSNVKEKALLQIEKEIREGMITSVHIRRGDYLQGNNLEKYGDICTDYYYLNAMKMIKKLEPTSRFCFFSNDIEWVKRNYPDRDAIYIDRRLFENYQDWYDLFLMTCCKNNIIANSTFSWWGAWLNQNGNKIVIAPSKWINGCIYKDIYPDEWIQIGSWSEE